MQNTKIIRIISLLTLVIAGMVVIGYMYHTGPQSDELVWNDKSTRYPATPMAVTFDDKDFDSSVIQYSTNLWNGIMPKGQPLFFRHEGDDDSVSSRVQIISSDGSVCDRKPWDPVEEEELNKDHSSRSYQCSDGSWQIHVLSPGNIHTQYCIIAHELGHVLGLADDSSGTRVMNQSTCPELVLISDKDSSAVIGRYRINE